MLLYHSYFVQVLFVQQKDISLISPELTPPSPPFDYRLPPERGGRGVAPGESLHPGTRPGPLPTEAPRDAGQPDCAADAATVGGGQP